MPTVHAASRHGTPSLKGQGHVTVNKPVISTIYIVAQGNVAIVFRSDFGGWGESTIKLLLEIHQYLCNPTSYECLWFISLENSRVHLQNNTYILRKVLENLCDMDYQKS